LRFLKIEAITEMSNDEISVYVCGLENSSVSRTFTKKASLVGFGKERKLTLRP